nr:replication protein A 70 kDa DNA-binding subunit D-like [Ipomoea trifida]
MYILGREISPLNTRSALRLRAVRVYDIPERQPSASMKSTEVVFHDQEDFELENEAESPLQVVGIPLSTDLNDNAVVKRSLIDEFSSTQSSKKTKEHVVKVEDLNDL